MTQADLPSYLYSWKKSEESGKFQARCTEIPDLYAYGDTSEEALYEIKEAVVAWLEVLTEDGLPFPDPIIPTQEPPITAATAESFHEPRVESEPQGGGAAIYVAATGTF